MKRIMSNYLCYLILLPCHNDLKLEFHEWLDQLKELCHLFPHHLRQNQSKGWTKTHDIHFVLEFMLRSINYKNRNERPYFHFYRFRLCGRRSQCTSKLVKLIWSIYLQVGPLLTCFDCSIRVTAQNVLKSWKHSNLNPRGSLLALLERANKALALDKSISHILKW